MCAFTHIYPAILSTHTFANFNDVFVMVVDSLSLRKHLYIVVTWSVVTIYSLTPKERTGGQEHWSFHVLNPTKTPKNNQ